MKLHRGVVCGLGLLVAPFGSGGPAAAVAAEPATPSASPPAAAAPKLPEAPAPMAYTDAGNGLPSGRIWKSQIAFGDVNGDGLPDIGVVSRLADGPWIFVGDGKGNWKEFANGLPREPFCGGGMDFLDVNKDGITDVAIADHCKGVYVFLGDGKGNWKMASSGLPNIGSEDVALGDFNNDGCADLASVAAAEEGVRAFTGNCKGVWKETSNGLSITDWGNAVELKDVNGDGNLDIIAAYAAGPRVWIGNGKGEWKEASQGLPAPEIHGLYWGLDVEDINGDGKLDIVTGSAMPPLPENCGQPGAPACAGGGVEAFLQKPDGTWESATVGLQPMNALGVAMGDLNNDKKPDLVVVGKQALNEIGGVYGVYTYLGDGTGKWVRVVPNGLPQTGRERAWGVGLADINKDGVLDLAVAFGDVVAPNWRSNAKTSPERGKFGSVGVWTGQINGAK
ncbi:MAG: FG-GAP repeat domain-containing protein [Candidatus Binatia bacterium]